MSEQGSKSKHIPSCTCSGDNCKCGDKCKCLEHKTDCKCGSDCKCGDKCKCMKKSCSNASCKCGDDCKCGDQCKCGTSNKKCKNPTCPCANECKCGDKCKCGSSNTGIWSEWANTGAKIWGRNLSVNRVILESIRVLIIERLWEHKFLCESHSRASERI